jgi:sarcosine oxidase subunit gamma
MAELTRRHPLDSIEAELTRRNDPAATITAEPFVAMVDVRLPTADSTPLLGTNLPTTADSWVPTGTGRVIWLGPDEWLLTSTAHTPEELEGQIRDTVRPVGGAATDVSAQRIELRLTGSRVREVLAKGCSIDLHPRVFARGRAAQTTVGLAGVILLALSDAGDDFLVLVRSSFAGYLAEWLLDAALEFAAPTADRPMAGRR